MFTFEQGERAMIHDIEICKECHYMKIEDHSCRERHCRKCDNYGEKMLPATLTIIQCPVEVNFECPHCHEDIEIEYCIFTDFIETNNPRDWEGSILACPRCEKEIEIDEVEWD